MVWGAGEPFNNFDAVMRAIQIATHPMGLHFSKNKVTVSTVGLVPQLRRFCRSGVPAQLAVSLHAPNDALRSTIVPVNRTHSLRLLTDCLRCVPRAGPPAAARARECPRPAASPWLTLSMLVDAVVGGRERTRVCARSRGQIVEPALPGPA